MVHPDHQSAAEGETPLDERALRRYRWYARIGVIGLLLDGVATACLFLGVLPDQGPLTITTILFLAVTVPTFVVLLITGMSKGRDHRPSVMQMFGAGGRR
jgi:hypothetical protein